MKVKAINRVVFEKGLKPPVLRRYDASKIILCPKPENSQNSIRGNVLRETARFCGTKEA